MTEGRAKATAEPTVLNGEAFRRARDLALSLVDSPPPLLLVTDFDGTLSPIVQEPMGAIIEPLARTALRRLARLGDRAPARLAVVVLSGRISTDVAARVRVGGVRYLGNHGLEAGRLARRGRPDRITVRTDPTLEPWVPSTAALADAVADKLGRPDWLFVELKGPSVAFHFRQAPDVDRAREDLLAAIDSAEAGAGPNHLGMTRLDGRRIIELRPLGAGGKGAAMERLIERDRPGAVLMLGDDRSDAEGFQVIAEARARGELDGVTLAVHGARETPPEVLQWADVELASTHDAARVLAALARALETRSPAAV